MYSTVDVTEEKLACTCPPMRSVSAGGDRAVLYDERLVKPLGQPLTDQTRDDVCPATGRQADDDAHRPCRVGLRPDDARDDGRCGNARGQMQKLPAGKFHDSAKKSLRKGRVSARCKRFERFASASPVMGISRQAR